MNPKMKGCLNKKCSEHKITYFDADTNYCPKCGKELYFVCKEPGCYKKLLDNAESPYCELHRAEKKDLKEKKMKKRGIIAAILAFIASIILAIFKRK